MEEEWKDIFFEDKGILYDYRGLYQVSNLGNIKSLDRIIVIKSFISSSYRMFKGKNIKQSIHRGYKVVYLYDKNNKSKCHLVHRIIAKMFIPNPKKLPIINHKNGIKTDNQIENLEWCTYSQNLKHAYKNGLKNSTYKQLEKLHKLNEKIVYQYDLNNNFIKKYYNKIDLENEGYNKKQVNRVCRKERKTYKGYKWSYYKIN